MELTFRIFGNKILQIHSGAESINNKYIFEHVDFEPKKRAVNKRPHPYFGYIYDYRNLERPENFKKKTDGKRIGIFGGSVAQGLNFSKIKDEMGKRLHLTNSETIIFAVGGHRQPQQKIMSSTLAEGIDFSINLEGVNELLSHYSQHFPIYYPMTSMSDFYFSSPANYIVVGKIVELTHQAFYLKEKLKNHKYLLRTLEMIDRFRTLRLDNKLFDLKNSELKIPDDIYPERITFKDKALLWLTSSCMQQNILAHHNVNSLYFVQPIPSLYKPLSSQEKKYFEIDPIAEANIEAYKKITENVISDLQKAGLNIHSLLKIFSQTKETVYLDSCCHLIEEKRILLLNAMEKNIKIAFKKAPQFCDLKAIQKVVEATW